MPRIRTCEQCGERAVIKIYTRGGWVCDQCLFADCEDPMLPLDLEAYVHGVSALGERIVHGGQAVGDAKRGYFRTLHKRVDKYCRDHGLIGTVEQRKAEMLGMLQAKGTILPSPRGSE